MLPFEDNLFWEQRVTMSIVNRAGLSGRLPGEVNSSRGGFRTNRILQKIHVEIAVLYVCCILPLRVD